MGMLSAYFQWNRVPCPALLASRTDGVVRTGGAGAGLGSPESITCRYCCCGTGMGHRAIPTAGPDPAPLWALPARGTPGSRCRGDAVPCCAVPCHAVRCHAVPCRAVQCHGAALPTSPARQTPLCCGSWPQMGLFDAKLGIK